jgi:hypothetical protein
MAPNLSDPASEISIDIGPTAHCILEYIKQAFEELLLAFCDCSAMCECGAKAG